MKNFARLWIIFFALSLPAFSQTGLEINDGNLLIDMIGVNQGVFRSYLNISEDAFQFRLIGGDDLVTYPNVGTFHRHGAVINQSRTFTEFMRGPGTINNTPYETIFLLNYPGRATSLTFECENFTVPYTIVWRRQATYRVHCKMEGSLAIYASPSSLMPLFSTPIYGTATAHLRFERHTHDPQIASRYRYLLRSVNYVFDDAPAAVK